MNPDYIAVLTNGKIYVSSDYDQIKALALVAHIYEVSPVGKTPVLLATFSGAAPPYTVTSAAVVDPSSGYHKVRS